MAGCAPGFRQASEPAAAARRSACSSGSPAASAAREIAAKRVAGADRIDRRDLQRRHLRASPSGVAAMHAVPAQGDDHRAAAGRREGAHACEPVGADQSQRLAVEVELGLVGDDIVGLGEQRRRGSRRKGAVLSSWRRPRPAPPPAPRRRSAAALRAASRRRHPAPARPCATSRQHRALAPGTTAMTFSPSRRPGSAPCRCWHGFRRRRRDRRHPPRAGPVASLANASLPTAPIMRTPRRRAPPPAPGWRLCRPARC